jgi:hypothetical protein
MRALIFATLFTLSSPLHAEDWTHYGAAFTLDAPITAAELIATPDAHMGKTIQVKGRVADVCQKMGCWMVLTPTSGEGMMRVMMQDHAFSVARNSTGVECIVEGIVSRKSNDPQLLAHLKSEAGDATKVPEEGKSHVYSFAATGVSMPIKEAQ